MSKRRSSLVWVARDLGGFLWTHKKWWLLPVILVLALMATLMALGSTPAAPFVYTLF